MAIIGMTGLSYPAARLAVDLYEEGGYAGLKLTPHGCASGEGRMLTGRNRKMCVTEPMASMCVGVQKNFPA